MADEGSILVNKASEKWFAEYLTAHGYSFEFEPELGGIKNPDFAIEREGIKAICEVKEFETLGIVGLMAKQLNTLITRPVKKLLDPVRNQIGSAAQQLKEFQDTGSPLIVVLANPHDAGVNLSETFVISAMYGDIGTRFSIGTNGETISEDIVGRNGRLTNDHQYVSAVVVVNRHEKNQEESNAFIEDLYRKNPLMKPEVAMQLLKEEEVKFEPEVISYNCTVFETASQVCTPLPATFFNGPNDIRWRCSEGKMIRMN